MNINFTPHGWQDFEYLILNEPDASAKVLELIARTISPTEFTLFTKGKKI